MRWIYISFCENTIVCINLINISWYFLGMGKYINSVIDTKPGIIDKLNVSELEYQIMKKNFAIIFKYSGEKILLYNIIFICILHISVHMYLGTYQYLKFEKFLVRSRFIYLNSGIYLHQPVILLTAVYLMQAHGLKPCRISRVLLA